MCLFQFDDDPEPEEPAPAGLLYVPVRPGTHAVAVRVFHTPPGSRTTVGLTTVERPAATLGAEQSWICLPESVLRSLAEPLGVEPLTVDPTLTAPAVTGPGASAGSLRAGSAVRDVGHAARTA
ncbi:MULTISPECIES: SAV_915 family protein [Streptomyces]|uniref:SseB protein N-terminal domain-containing protein n=1 Tax=Streptomyces viridochromogenes TaxID=1938 RepID=A0A0L8JJF5_STRVR|nr:MULTISPECIES: SAV_915 family protein [Streptomyces]KOG13807.1 hypothetical protein ADK34_30040 [Streptomyces viridochromogenes]